MPIEIRITNKPIPMSALPVGEFCRRVADHVYFLKTSEGGRRFDDNKQTFLCVNIEDGCAHCIREDTIVEQVPRTVIGFIWTKD